MRAREAIKTIKYTKDKLISLGYKIENAKITKADLSMEDYGCLTLWMELECRTWGCCYGGYCLGHGYVGADDNCFDGTAKGIEFIARIMDVVGTSHFNDMTERYVRVATKGWGDSVRIIGNIIEDKWFDSESFFKDENEKE